MNLENFRFRPPIHDDAQAVMDLLNRCDMSEYGTPDTDMEDLLHDWSLINLEQDAWLAVTPNGDLVGYAAVLPWGKDVRYVFHTEPVLDGEALAQALLAYCKARGPKFAAEHGGSPDSLARVFVSHVNLGERKLLENSGFKPDTYHLQMRMDLEAELPEPDWPEGISVRTAEPEEDDYAIFELVQAAFYQPGRERQSFEEWKTFMMRPEIYDPGLWSLAFHGERLVGASLGFAYPLLGWVRQLGVAADWQRKGLGAALLRHSFLVFKQRGYQQAGLGVESRRPEAFQFYLRAGMYVARQYDQYVKPLG